MKTHETSESLKELVKEKYSQIADQSYTENATSCCGAGSSCGSIDYTIMAEDYTHLKGYVADADLGLGCGLPTEFALIKEGDTVIDLGSGAGNDAFVAHSITGEKGKVIGIDFTEKMIEKARTNAEKLGFNNVEFRYGDIEKMPVTANVADVVVSNCVLNLVPNKKKAFEEMFRVIKPGGHFSVSDIVLQGELPEGLQKSAEMYAGCVAGAIQQEEYLQLINAAGFENATVQKERKINIPNEILSIYLTDSEMEKYKSGTLGIYSITVYGEKPGADRVKQLAKEKKAACCGPDSTCC
ncbi:MAG: arsenite methyltransferase [Cyclobacteriaceae bacterium]|nr:arsenite methyltransferase [Cyclobacteriaceae bacterium]